MKKNLIKKSVIVIFLIILTLLCFYSKLKNKALNVSNNISDERTIIIDAGHGGEDGGAVGIDGTIEKNINLQITEKLVSIMKLYGYKIILTRIDDNSIHSSDAKTIRQKKVSDIHNREKIIINNPQAIFISIHQNKFNDPSVHGTQVFYSKNNQLSPILAQCVQDSFVNNLQKDNYRKIKKSGTEIYLLYHSEIPSIMVECGFLSNSDDLKNLKDEKYQTKIAQTIADGIIKYYKEQDETNGTKR